MKLNLISKLALAKIVFLVCILALSASALSVLAQDTAKPGVPPLEKPKLDDIIDKNSEIRNDKMMEAKKNMEARKDIRDARKEEVKGIKKDFKDARKDINASSTEMFKAMKDQRREMAKNMRMDVFGTRKNALVKELNLSITNITSVRARINERITKLETEGKVMTDAKTALATADDKLAQAKIAVEAFSKISYTASTTKATGTASTATGEVELDKPRLAGDTAIKSVKDARNAFKKVVEIISQIK